MQQSNFIFGALAVAFVVFITTRGSLPAYMSVLFGTAAAPAAPQTSAGGASVGMSGSGNGLRSEVAGMATRAVIGGVMGGLGAL